jgi:hypothetical protein
MSASDRHGWSFSLFAAAFACLPEAIWLYFSRQGIHSPASISLLIFVTVNALVSARLGGLLAVRLGTSDHGFWAGAITWWIFSLFLSIFYFARPILAPLPSDSPWTGTTVSIVGTAIGGVVAIFYFSSLIVAPACFIGTALFRLLLRAVGNNRIDR